MGRLIDADALEREGWSLCRNYQQDKNTMVYETKSIAEIPTAQPEEKILTEKDYAYCLECVHVEMCRWYPTYGCEFKGRPSAQPTQSNGSNTLNALDCISRQAAIGALWEALYSYEDKTEKQFIESDELDVGDWMLHREFVQNMSDIDRQTILELPSAQPERKKGKWIKLYSGNYKCSVCGDWWGNDCNDMVEDFKYCPNCGADMRGKEE